MAAVSVTATAVLGASTAVKEHGTAGATITAGQVVYLDSATNTYKLADCDDATAAVRQPRGIALNGGSSGQPLTIIRSGAMTMNAALTAGTAYYLAPTAGGFGPLADVLSGDDVVLIGLATSTTVLNIDIQITGVTL